MTWAELKIDRWMMVDVWFGKAEGNYQEVTGFMESQGGQLDVSNFRSYDDSLGYLCSAYSSSRTRNLRGAHTRKSYSEIPQHP
jgi:hypothetical protein